MRYVQREASAYGCMTNDLAREKGGRRVLKLAVIKLSLELLALR